MDRDTFPTVPYRRERLTGPEMIARSFADEMRTRRSVREFSSDEIPGEVLELAVAAAASAPSGANLQPWSFVIVRDPDLKRRPMGFLREILGRPKNEKAYLLIPVGDPDTNCRVPDIHRKPLAEVMDWR